MAPLHEWPKNPKKTLQLTLNDNKIKCPAYFVCNQGRTFDPFTHVYAFDKGFLHSHIFHKSTTTKYFTSSHPPEMLFECEFKLKLLFVQETVMHGSGEENKMHLYQKIS